MTIVQVASEKATFECKIRLLNKRVHFFSFWNCISTNSEVAIPPMSELL